MHKLNFPQLMPIPRTHALERPWMTALLERLLLISRASHSNRCRLHRATQHLLCHSVFRGNQHRRCFRAPLQSHGLSTLHRKTRPQHRLSIPRCEALSRRLVRLRPRECIPWSTAHPRRMVLHSLPCLRTRRRIPIILCRLQHFHKRVTALRMPPCSQRCCKR